MMSSTTSAIAILSYGPNFWHSYRCHFSNHGKGWAPRAWLSAKETSDIVPVRQTSLESFETMFDYIYNKTIEWGNVSVLEMYYVVNLAEKYHIPGMLDVVKILMENVHLTMENVIEVADAAAQFNQFPTISSSLIQSYAKFLKTNLKTDGELLQFAISHSGSGQEATALHLLALAKNMPGNPICSNCEEENCQDKFEVACNWCEQD